jgi:hypothetical protein
MTVFEWMRNDKYAGYLGVGPADEAKMDWHPALPSSVLPPLSQWEPPRLAQYLGQGKKPRKPKPIGDAPGSGLCNLISQRAADALSDIWDRHALLYPVVLDDAPDPYYMVVVQTVIDALDRERSVGKLQKYGPTPDLFAVIDEWVFHEDQLGDAMLFRLPDSKTAMYVTEVFKNRVVAAKLKGFCLKRSFWEEKPFIS